MGKISIVAEAMRSWERQRKLFIMLPKGRMVGENPLKLTGLGISS